MKLKLILSFRKQIFILFFFALLSSGFFLIGPYFSKLFIDKSFLNHDLSAFFRFTFFGAGVFLSSIFFRVAGDALKNRFIAKVKLRLADKFIKKLYSLDLAFLQSKSIGENIYRFSDIDRIDRFLLERFPALLLDIFKIPVILAISIVMNFRLTIFIVLLSPLFLLHGMYMRKKLRPIYAEMWKTSVRISKKINEAFSRMLIIKTLGLESFQRRSHLRLLLENIRLGLKSFRWSVIGSVSSAFLAKAIFGAVSLYGGWMVIKENLSLGSYTAVMLYLTQLGAILQSLSSNMEYFIQDAISVERFLEFADTAPKITDSAGAVKIKSIKGEIKFSQVSFGYRDGRPIFQGLDFEMPAAEWVGVAGPSGCGKTTLINLILRLFDPSEGEIRLDGLNLKEINLRSLRERVSIATQEPFLFDLTVQENIAYGLRHASPKQIEEASRIVQLHDYIMQLPDGYNTLIGENACRLSQGYKQRVALARVILRDPDLLILDEATASIDSATEEKVFRALRQRRHGRSTIVISHRLFSIKDADRVYFLRRGEVMECGSHEELMAKSGYYRGFFRNQTEESGAGLKVLEG